MSHISNTRRRRRDYERLELWVKLWRFIGGCCATVLIALFFSFVLINWLSGCGERFPTADGGYVQGECVSPVDLFREPTE